MQQSLVLLRKIDFCIRETKMAEAIKLFYNFENKKWPRELLLPLCHIARRLNKPMQIVQWMHPLIRSEKKLDKEISTEEIAIYSIGLTRIGAFSEAEVLLKQLPTNIPDVQLALMQLKIFEWKYLEAIRPIRRYMKLIDKKSYFYKVAQVNLLACYVVKEDWNKTNVLAAEVLNQLSAEKEPLIRANALETLAQACIRQKNFKTAINYLDEAGQILKNTGSRYELFVKKWKLILSLSRTNIVDADEVQRLIQDAINLKDYETVREINFYIAVTRRDTEMFKCVYWGTRFSGYRKRMKAIYQPSRQELTGKSVNFKSINYTDVRVINLDLLKFEMNPLCYQLLCIVMLDFFRPLQIGEVFKELYPGEYFNPFTSKNRVYQMYMRSNVELKKAKIQIKLIWANGQIGWASPHKIEKRIRGIITQIVPRWLEALPQSQPHFTVMQIQKNLNVSKKTVQRQIRKLISMKLVKRTKLGLYKKI